MGRKNYVKNVDFPRKKGIKDKEEISGLCHNVEDPFVMLLVS